MYCDTMDLVGKVRGQGLAQDHGLVPDHELVVVYLNQLFFIKAIKAAGQSSLSKFEAI